MEETTKLSYETPVAKVLELNGEGIICQSPGFPSDGFGKEKDW